MCYSKKVISMILAFALPLSLSISAKAAVSESALKDMQTHHWTETVNTEIIPQVDDVSNPRDFWLLDLQLVENNSNIQEAYNLPRYDVDQLTNDRVAHFMLYNNGDLYLSMDERLTEEGFSKIMSNVKSIGTITVPLFDINYLVESSKYLVNKTYAEFSEFSNGYSAISVNLTVILDNNGKLYIMGCPDRIAEEYCHYSKNDSYDSSNPSSSSVAGGGWSVLWTDQSESRPATTRKFRTTVTIERVFPFPYQASVDTIQEIADGVSEIVALSSLTHGFYIDQQGDSYFGFPSQDDTNELAPTNVIDFRPGGNIQLLNDGTLYYGNGDQIASDVKELAQDYYLTNENELYTIYGGIISSQVKSISDNGSFYIKEDNSLWHVGDKQKIMDDVAAIFGDAYPVTSNGDIYSLDMGVNGMFAPRKMISGSGVAPIPAIPFYMQEEIPKSTDTTDATDVEEEENTNKLPDTAAGDESQDKTDGDETVATEEKDFPIIIVAAGVIFAAVLAALVLKKKPSTTK